MCKKQSSISLSTAEAVLISAGLGCDQILWMQHTLKDFGFEMNESPLYCDNASAISITKNLVLYSITKHIKVKCPFIREHVHERGIDIKYASMYQHLRDIFTSHWERKNTQSLEMTWASCPTLLKGEYSLIMKIFSSI